MALVDGFNFPDSLLNSALGRYDGRVYEVNIKQIKPNKLNKPKKLKKKKKKIKKKTLAFI